MSVSTSCFDTHRFVPSLLGGILGAGGMVLASDTVQKAIAGNAMCTREAVRVLDKLGLGMNSSAKTLIQANSTWRSSRFVISMLMVAAGMGLLMAGSMMSEGQTAGQNVSLVLSALLVLVVTYWQFAFMTDTVGVPNVCLNGSLEVIGVGMLVYFLAWLWFSASVGMYQGGSGGAFDHGKFVTALIGGGVATVGILMYAKGQWAAASVCWGVAFLLTALATAMVPSSSKCAGCSSMALVKRWERVVMGV